MRNRLWQVSTDPVRLLAAFGLVLHVPWPVNHRSILGRVLRLRQATLHVGHEVEINGVDGR